MLEKIVFILIILFNLCYSKTESFIMSTTPVYLGIGSIVTFVRTDPDDIIKARFDLCKAAKYYIDTYKLRQYKHEVINIYFFYKNGGLFKKLKLIDKDCIDYNYFD